MPIYLIVFVVAWVVAQGSKYLLESYKNKKASFKTIITESGGMPSSHSAVVIAITTLIALREGVHSSIFGIAFAFAIAFASQLYSKLYCFRIFCLILPIHICNKSF